MASSSPIVDLFKFSGLVSSSPEAGGLEIHQDEYVKQHFDPKRVIKIIDREDQERAEEEDSDVAPKLVRVSGESESTEVEGESDLALTRSYASAPELIPAIKAVEASLSKPRKPAIKPYVIDDVLSKSHPRLVKVLAHKYGISYNGEMSEIIAQVSKALKTNIYKDDEKCSSAASTATQEFVGLRRLTGESTHSDSALASKADAPAHIQFAQFGKVRFFDPADALEGQAGNRKDYIIKMDSKGGSIFKKHSWVSKLFAGIFGTGS
jgi:hypothetical protein